MSGICGILRFDGAAPDGIEAMTVHMQSRGPDGAQHFHDGACALGHTLLATTPEALHETMPLTHMPSGCTITADVRLDNRDELLPVLGLIDAGRVVGDGEIILHAYLKWGEDCPLHLLGDFAFAIWDSRAQRIFAARDHMGMKQLIH
jgi:asparagine synthase (glutamine-hydrolysing)